MTGSVSSGDEVNAEKRRKGAKSNCAAAHFGGPPFFPHQKAFQTYSEARQSREWLPGRAWMERGSEEILRSELVLYTACLCLSQRPDSLPATSSLDAERARSQRRGVT